MGFLSDSKNQPTNRRNPILIQSPSEDQRMLNAKITVQEGARAGAKAAAIACVASAIPTLISVRVFPWAKRNLNYTAQALIISSASIAAYFITADKTILEAARKNSREAYDKTVR